MNEPTDVNAKSGAPTEEGKRRSSRTASRQGVTDRVNQALESVARHTGVDYEVVLDKVRSTFWPADYVEDELVQRIALCLWRLGIMRSMELRLLGKKADRVSPGPFYESVLKAERMVSLELHRCIKTLLAKRGSRPVRDISVEGVE